jgi:chorismate mutase
MESHNPNIETLRHELQECDIRILMLLQERFRLAERLGMRKRHHDMEPYQETEWQRKILFLGSHLEGHPYGEEILRVFHSIHSESVEMQRRMTD